MGKPKLIIKRVFLYSGDSRVADIDGGVYANITILGSRGCKKTEEAKVLQERFDMGCSERMNYTHYVVEIEKVKEIAEYLGEYYTSKGVGIGIGIMDVTLVNNLSKETLNELELNKYANRVVDSLLELSDVADYKGKIA